MFFPKPCSECGSDPVHHWTERWLISFDRLFDGLFRPINPVLRLFYIVIRPLNSRLALVTFFVFEKLGWGSWRETYDEHDALRTRALFESALPRNIDLKEFRVFEQPHLGFLVARHNGKVVVFDGLPRPNFLLSKNLVWMDDKASLKKKFERAGFPVARGGAAFTERRALELFNSLEKPVITKPHIGSGSRHTTIHLENEGSFLKAFRSAKELSPWVIVEEELFGPVFRATVIGGELVGVVRRDPPRVIGDGKGSVRELVSAANEDPRRGGPIFSKIADGEDAEKELGRQGLSWEAVPDKGRIVHLNQKITWANGGTTEDVTGITHPANVALFERIAAFMNDPIIGIDFIITDISEPWQSQKRAGVIELNSMPFLDNHHYLFDGQPRDAAGAVWDVTFDTSSRSR